jgi:methyl-accepting chemotaxis protein
MSACAQSGLIEIGTERLITDSMSEVKDGVELVGRAGSALDEIVVSIRKGNEVIADIASASNEQSIGV